MLELAASHPPDKPKSAANDPIVTNVTDSRDNIYANPEAPPHTDRHHTLVELVCANGFSSSDVWFQCFNFASIIALK